MPSDNITLGLMARARALQGLDRVHEAVSELRQGVIVARQLGSGALFVQTAARLLALDGDESLAFETRTITQQVSAALPKPELRSRFEAGVSRTS